MQAQIKKDSFIKGIIDDLQHGKEVLKGYHLDRGVLKYKGIGVHSGDLKTYFRLDADMPDLSAIKELYFEA